MSAPAFYGKTVLVTGHTGFKGSWLSLYLHTLGAHVVGVSLPLEEPSHFSLLQADKFTQSHFVDIRDLGALKDIFKKTSFDFVFHLAAQALVSHAYKDPYQTFTSNTYGTINILECIRQFETPCSVITTSDKAYRNIDQIWPYRENDVLAGFDPYSASKSAADIIIQSYIHSVIDLNKQGLAITRAGNVIGGGDWNSDRIIPDFVRSLENETPLVIRNPGSTRPWNHVLEPVFGYVLLAEKLSHNKKKFSDAFNFGPSPEQVFSVEDLIKESIRFYGKGEYLVDKNSSVGKEAGLLSIDITKARLVLDWVPKLSFSETVKMTMEWYSAYHQKQDIFKLSTNQIKEYADKS